MGWAYGFRGMQTWLRCGSLSIATRTIVIVLLHSRGESKEDQR